MSSAPSSRPGPSRPVAGARRTRRASERSPSPGAMAPSPPKRRRTGVVPPEIPKKAKVDPYKMRKSEVPKGAESFKAAFELHIRILIGAFSSSAIPQPPSMHDILTFEQRFNRADLVDQMLRNTHRNYVIVEDQVKRSLKELRAACAAEHGATVARSISDIPDHIIRLIFGAVHDFGLAAWRPELLTGSPTSIYHLSLEAIAIWTFEQALASFGYRTLNVNVGFINNTVLVKKIYANFVWSYLRNLVLKEHKEPGSVKKMQEATKAYRGRDELNGKRRQFLIDNGFPPRIVQLCADKECASDHERNADGTAFLVMRKRARNRHVTNFYRWIDQCLASGEVTPLLRGQKIRRLRTAPLPRVDHPDGKETLISVRLPVNTTLDWFDPDYFNRLDVRFRGLYINAPVALPAHEDCDDGADPRDSDWKKMLDEEFLAMYDGRVRERYHLPTPEEIEALDYDGDDEGDNGESGDDEGHGGNDGDDDQDEVSTPTAGTPQPVPAPVPVHGMTTTAAPPLSLPAPQAGPSQSQAPIDERDMDEDL